MSALSRSLTVLGIALMLLIGGLPSGASEPAAPPSASVLPLLAEIRARQAELDRRERALVERERSHAELERLVEAQIAEVADQRQLVAERIEAWEAQSGERIRKLAKIYAAMDPGRAARLLERLDSNLATQILSKMKHKKSAAVLERIAAARALTVSRQVARPLSFAPADASTGETR